VTADRDHSFEGTPVEDDVVSAGVRIHYLDWRSTSGLTILFLHGGGLNAHTWDVVCDLLHTEHRCVAVDLRGHGDSEWHADGDYSLEAYAADTAAVVDHLQLDRFVLVGMSLGGLAALTFAALHDRLAGLVLVDIGPSGGRDAGRRRVGRFIDGPREFASMDDLVRRAMAFNPLRSRKRLERTLLHSVRRTAHGTWAWKYDRRIHRPFDAASSTGAEGKQRAADRTRALWAAAHAVACPTLVVRGSISDMFLQEDAENTVAAFARARSVTIAGAGHTVQGDNPYELTSALREFIATDVTAFRSLSVEQR
jgi:pimeloyl-ACP methyl ester carboxylesterase